MRVEQYVYNSTLVQTDVLLLQSFCDQSDVPHSYVWHGMVSFTGEDIFSRVDRNALARRVPT